MFDIIQHLAFSVYLKPTLRFLILLYDHLTQELWLSFSSSSSQNRYSNQRYSILSSLILTLTKSFTFKLMFPHPNSFRFQIQNTFNLVIEILPKCLTRLEIMNHQYQSKLISILSPVQLQTIPSKTYRNIWSQCSIWFTKSNSNISKSNFIYWRENEDTRKGIGDKWILNWAQSNE